MRAAGGHCSRAVCEPQPNAQKKGLESHARNCPEIRMRRLPQRGSLRLPCLSRLGSSGTALLQAWAGGGKSRSGGALPRGLARQDGVIVWACEEGTSRDFLPLRNHHWYNRPWGTGPGVRIGPKCPQVSGPCGAQGTGRAVGGRIGRRAGQELRQIASLMSLPDGRIDAHLGPPSQVLLSCLCSRANQGKATPSARLMTPWNRRTCLGEHGKRDALMRRVSDERPSCHLDPGLPAPSPRCHGDFRRLGLAVVLVCHRCGRSTDGKPQARYCSWLPGESRRHGTGKPQRRLLCRRDIVGLAATPCCTYLRCCLRGGLRCLHVCQGGAASATQPKSTFEFHTLQGTYRTSLL